MLLFDFPIFSPLSHFERIGGNRSKMEETAIENIRDGD